jgi:hypothetical protein
VVVGVVACVVVGAVSVFRVTGRRAVAVARHTVLIVWRLWFW